MPYIVKNLAYSSRDQNGLRIRLSASSKRLIFRMRVCGKRLSGGTSISISDDEYSSNKSIIDQYVTDGLISLKAVGVEPEGVVEPKVEPEKTKRRTRGKAKPKVVKSAPPPAPIEESKKVEEVSSESSEEESKGSRILRRLRKKSE